MTKVPYNPVTGQKASVDKPETFVDFNTAVKAANAYSGIGIRITGQIIAIDLDHCIEDDVLLPWASEITERFRDTYIETSPSGTGLRILALMPDGYVYDSNIFYIKKWIYSMCKEIQLTAKGLGIKFVSQFLGLGNIAYFKKRIIVHFVGDSVGVKHMLHHFTAVNVNLN